MDLITKNIIGKGGFGTAYFIEDKITGKQYIAKTLETGSRFENNETDILLKLKPFCKKYFSCMLFSIRINKSQIIVMDYIKNSTDLKFLLQKPLYPDNVGKLIMMKHLLEGLDILHNNKIIHNDIKPANIISVLPFEMRYIDYGLSCFFDQYDCGLKRGTATYTSPVITYLYSQHSIHTFPRELLANVKDVYSLGITFLNIIKWDTTVQNTPPFKKSLTGRMINNRDKFNKNLISIYKKYLNDGDEQFTFNLSNNDKDDFEDILEQMLTLSLKNRKTVPQLLSMVNDKLKYYFGVKTQRTLDNIIDREGKKNPYGLYKFSPSDRTFVERGSIHKSSKI